MNFIYVARSQSLASPPVSFQLTYYDGPTYPSGLIGWLGSSACWLFQVRKDVVSERLR